MITNRQERRTRTEGYSDTDTSDMAGKITGQLIFPFLQAEIGIGALRLDDTLHVGVSCMHTELKRSWFARCPAVYGFRGIDAAAFGCGKYVERPENPAMNKSYDW
jgi:hypothetical protein